MNKIISRNLLCNTISTPYICYQGLARLAIGRLIPTPPSEPNFSGVNVSLTNVDPAINAIESRTLVSAKEIMDPDNENCVIPCEILEYRIPYQVLFNAALHGLANLAVTSNDAPCTNIAGLSSSGEVTYMVGNGPPRDDAFHPYVLSGEKIAETAAARLYQDDVVESSN